MKNHFEIYQALIDGKELINKDNYRVKLINGVLNDFENEKWKPTDCSFSYP